MKQQKTAIIIRYKIYANPSIPRNYKFAWKYFYDVGGLGIDLFGFDLLDDARSAAKRYGATEIICAWKLPVNPALRRTE